MCMCGCPSIVNKQPKTCQAESVCVCLKKETTTHTKTQLSSHTNTHTLRSLRGHTIYE